MAFSVALAVKNLPANAGDVKRHRFNPWVGKIPWRRKWQATPSRVAAWRVPWTEEPWQAIQSTGSQSVGHNQSNLAHMYQTDNLSEPSV